ncbi:transcription elongation factor Spt5 [Candidatus Woesearchaeota archaeon]|nr:transcription elongation factor Spt5 [Candidatus Woesearchaeota archaeon]
MEKSEQGQEQPTGIPIIAGAEAPAPKEEIKEVPKEVKKDEGVSTHIFALRTTANREDQVLDFIGSNIKKKKLPVYSVIRPHGMRGYIFVESLDRQSAEQAAFNVPYARGILPKEIQYVEIEHMLEQVKREVDIRKSDIVEIISGPFKRENAKVTRIDRTKEEVVVELLGAAVPIPITVKMDAVKVIRRESEGPAPDSLAGGEDGEV